MGAEHRKFCFGAGVAGMEGVAGPSSPPAAAILLDRRQTEEIAKTLFLTAPRHSRGMVAQQQRAEALPCLSFYDALSDGLDGHGAAQFPSLLAWRSIQKWEIIGSRRSPATEEKKANGTTHLERTN